MKAIAIVALALALEGGFVLAVGAPARVRTAAPAATASSAPAQAPASRS